MHTQLSRTYRQHCIQGHTQQNFATVMAMLYVESHYRNCIKHKPRLLQAFRGMRGKV